MEAGLHISKEFNFTRTNSPAEARTKVGIELRNLGLPFQRFGKTGGVSVKNARKVTVRKDSSPVDEKDRMI